MLVVFIILTGLLGVCGDNILSNQMLVLREDSKEDNLISCVLHIVKKYYVSEELLTFVEMGYDDDRLLQAIHALSQLNIVHRKPISPYFSYNRAYLLTSENVTDFVQNFPYLTQDPTWNPHAKFIIVIKRMKKVEMRKIFDVLLEFHILNVVIVNGTDPFLYTYNPYEDYACGKYYTRIINFGRCPTPVDLYPYKLTTGLRRCTVNIAVPHWPPYTMHPSKMKHAVLSKGVEQFLMDIIGNKEQFNISYIYKDQNEEYSTITKNMTATGPLRMLQRNETDMMMGGMALSPTKAAAFDFISDHLPLVDELVPLIRTPSYKPVWTNFYLTFHFSVWLLLLLCLMTFAALMSLLLENHDVGYVYLMMLETLLLHGWNISSRWAVKCIFLFWVWFAYLVNCSYQTSLVGLTTKPTEKITYTKVTHLVEYNLKLCLSPFMTKFIETEREYATIPITPENFGCDTFLASIKTVSEIDDRFTIVMYTIYFYHKYEFYDIYGKSRVRHLDTLFKVNYSIFMYKGFPMTPRLRMLTLRLRESGLVQNYIRFQHYIQNTEYARNATNHRELRRHLVVPWYLYIFGHLVGIIVFFAELISKIKESRRKKINKGS